ncbi:hypothetical protein LTR37_004282 [Vermiconidia calcicola]|uniref:Uncharacterized protein n=1 Tax=Vermiconidia calcicola TaxID=1690605 RepID=A0ACC3NMH3_9PEZI|nr:hypothetical protein LTR37_004282 [Vermiconidia calcicola]
MAPCLQSLPPELAEMISEDCLVSGDPLSLLALRLACREIETSTRRTWVRYFFTWRTVELDSAKLNKLQEIMNVPELASAVTALNVMCKDDAKLDDIGGSETRLTQAFPVALVAYPPKLALTLQNTRNLQEIYFQPHYDVAGNDIDYDGRIVVDYSATLAVVMSALHACDLRPTIVSDFQNEDFRLGIVRCRSMTHLAACFSNLECLEMNVFDAGGLTDSAVFGVRLTAGLNNMRYLKTLYLGFSQSRRSDKVFETLAEAAFLPSLAWISLQALDCTFKDLTLFLCKHAATLQGCDLFDIKFQDRRRLDLFTQLLELLHKSFHLERLNMMDMRDLTGKYGFSGMEQAVCYDEPDEEEYVFVEHRGEVRFETQDEVKHALNDMLNLPSLPPELLEILGDCIDSPDEWAALRLTCRQIQNATRRVWKKRFFMKRDIFLNRKSLSELVELSMVADLAGAVRGIFVQCEDDSKYLGYPASEQTLSPEPPSGLEPNEVLSLLLLALSNLANLIVVILRDAEDTPGKIDEDAFDGDYIVRYTFAFNQVMSAVEGSGLCPKVVASLQSIRATSFGTMDCSILSKIPRCLSKIEEFRTSVLVDGMGGFPVAPRFSGSEFGQQLVAGLSLMHSLRHLELELEKCPESLNALRVIFNAVFIPGLEGLVISETCCGPSILARFLRKHSATLRNCELAYMDWTDGEHEDERFSHILEELRHAQLLERLVVADMATARGDIDFPGMTAVKVYENNENEDGYVEVFQQIDRAVELEGVEQVQSGIPKMLECVVML